MNGSDVKQKVDSWAGLAWALLPLAAIALFVLAPRGAAPEKAAAQAPAGSPSAAPAAGFEWIVPAQLDAAASRDEPLARHGQ